MTDDKSQVQFWGAAQTVTGSMHLVQHRGRSVLLDCGLYQGRRKEAFRRNRQLPFDASGIDAVVLSHAHIDHSGNLPSLVRAGFRGKIYATPPTRSLAVHLLLDAAQIQVSDVRYVNKRRKTSGQAPFEPLYEQTDAVAALNRFIICNYDTPFHPVPGMTCRFFVAGHMLGAAHVEVMFETDQAPPLRLLYSGDIGRTGAAMLKDPTVVPDANYLIMESTYGDRTHPPDSDVESELETVVKRTWSDRGKLIIPAFSVGRTQEIIYHLNNLRHSGKLPPIKVFLDSPLAIDAHTIFQEYFDQFDEEFARRILDADNDDPLDFPDLFFVRKANDSKALNRYQDPCIIISASGMCESGRVLHHLKQHIGDPASTVLLTGYQASQTLGRRLQDGAQQVNILGQHFRVRARVIRLPGNSGHADQRELLQWASDVAAAGQLRQLALVHGEPESANALAAKLADRGLAPVVIPQRGDVMQLQPAGEAPPRAGR